MKKIVGSFLFLLITSCVFAQFSGRVLNSNAEALAGATVMLKNKSKVAFTATNPKGEFSFTSLEPGSYDLSVSMIGYSVEIDVVFISNAPKYLEIQLTPVSGQLQSVEVIGRASKKYNSDYSFSATKVASLVKDIPQSINSVTKELIADRQAFQLADAVKVASGVTPSSYYNQYAIRGISQNEEGQIINGLRTRQYYFIQPITSNVERVEVIKGPASVTFSSVDPGGSINIVTKKPLAVSRKEVSFSAGSFNTLRATLDFTGPINQDKTLLYRINGAYQEAKSFRDLVRNNAMLISPSFTYVPNKNTSVNVEMILSNAVGNLDRGQPIFGAVAGVTNLNSTPKSLNLGAPNDFFKSKEFILTTTLQHRFTSNISFNFAYMKQTWTEDLQEHRTTGAFAVDMNNQAVTSLAGMQFVQRKQLWNVDNINAYFNIEGATGKIDHRLLIGLDYSGWEKTKGGGQNAARGFVLTNGSITNTYNPANASNYQTVTVRGITLPRPNVNYFDLTSPTYTVRNLNDYTLNVRTALPSALTTNFAAYVQEQASYKKWKLLLSLRQEWFKDITNYNAPGEQSFTNTALIPRIGVTYSLTKNINLYATYLKGFQPQSNTVTLMPNTGSFFNTAKSAAQFKPLESELYEAGAKMELLKGKIVLTSAYYEITQKNLLLNANLPAYPDSLVTRGEEKSKGFEIDFVGYLLPEWQINGSYSYIDARVVVDNDPTLVGARKQNTPYNSFNFWTRYNFFKVKKLRDLGIGFGVQSSSNKVPWFTRAFLVPGYTVLDAALYYKPNNSNMQISFNVNNLLNEDYWLGAQNYLRLFPGAPRNIMLTAIYKF